MKNKYPIIILSIFIFISLLITIFLRFNVIPSNNDTNHDAEVIKFTNVNELFNDEYQFIHVDKIFQPDAEQIKTFSELVYPADDTQSHDAGLLMQNKQRVVIHNGLPYFSYSSLIEKDAYVIHPMRLGTYIGSLGENDIKNITNVNNFLSSLLNVSVELPNKGIAWYYPKHYFVSRMLSKDYTYSAISQAQILGGLTKLSLSSAEVTPKFLNEVFTALLFPYEQGGILLDNKALLELPLYRGVPEIILNGWIDALLHVYEYAKYSGNHQANILFSNNIKFLSKILHLFDAPQMSLSRYSDTSPYRASIIFSNKNVELDDLIVKSFYIPKVSGLSAYTYDIKPEVLERKKFSIVQKYPIYDNQIISHNKGELDITLSCSETFDTVIFINKRNVELSMNKGVYAVDRAIPGNKGKVISFRGKNIPQGSLLNLSEIHDQLICGYPTNFSKNGHINYYHVYHVVALLHLAYGIEDEHIRHELIKWALQWYQYMETDVLEDGVVFESPDNTMADINKRRLFPLDMSFDELLSWAKFEINK